MYSILIIFSEDNLSLIDIFEKYNPEIVVNLAAQAGVRYSLSNPSTYIQSNIVVFKSSRML